MDSYQKDCIKVVTKLSECCIDENRKKKKQEAKISAEVWEYSETGQVYPGQKGRVRHY
jgi:hypothetical protein